MQVRASEGPGRPWPGKSKGPVTRRGYLGPRPASAAPTLRSGSAGLPAAPRSGLLERLEVAVRCCPPRAPPASHSLGPVVTSGHRNNCQMSGEWMVPSSVESAKFVFYFSWGQIKSD